MKRFCVTIAAFAALLLCVGDSHAFGRRGGRGGCGVSHGCGVSYGCGPSYGAPVSYGGYQTYSQPSYSGTPMYTYSGYSQPSYSAPSYAMPSYSGTPMYAYSGPPARYSMPVYSPGCSPSYSTGPIQPGQWIRTETGWAQVISVGPSRTETPREIRRMPEPEKEGGKKPKAPSIDD